eukprot:4684717-Alexandrium_andersonii.AAC.1
MSASLVGSEMCIRDRRRLANLRACCTERTCCRMRTPANLRACCNESALLCARACASMRARACCSRTHGGGAGQHLLV